MARRDKGQPFGLHAGRALADVITRVTRDARAYMAPIEAEHRRRVTEEMMDDWEGEIGAFGATMLEGLDQWDDPPRWARRILERTTNPQNQTDFIENLIITMMGAFSLVGQAASIIWRGRFQNLQSKYQNAPLSPADAADGVIRGLLSPFEAKDWSAKSGTDPAAMDVMIGLTGEPPPLDEMRTLLVQGRITPSDFEQIFRYSRVRTDWLDDYTMAHYKPLSAADAVEGYIKGRLDHGAASEMFGVGGGMPDQFDIAAAIAGNPIGVEQALALFNHHLINEDDARKVIRHSRINPEFEDMALLTRFHYLSVFQIERMLTQGTVDPNDAAKWLMDEGLPADQVAGLIKGATTTKAGKAKLASESLVLDNYEAGFITHDQAVTQLGNLGYHAEEAAIIIESYDARRVLALRNQGVTAVSKAYKAGQVSKGDASSDLDALGVTSTLRDHYLALWDVERRTEFKIFTKAEVGSLLKKGFVSADWASKQWLAMGYNVGQIPFLLAEYGAGPDGGGVIA